MSQSYEGVYHISGLKSRSAVAHCRRTLSGTTTVSRPKLSFALSLIRAAGAPAADSTPASRKMTAISVPCRLSSRGEASCLPVSLSLRIPLFSPASSLSVPPYTPEGLRTPPSVPLASCPPLSASFSLAAPCAPAAGRPLRSIDKPSIIHFRRLRNRLLPCVPVFGHTAQICSFQARKNPV